MIINYLYFPQFNPKVLSIGIISLYWYSLIYIVSFLFIIRIICTNIYLLQIDDFNRTKIEDFLYSSFVGVILGGRIGYVLFYNVSMFIGNPCYLWQVWHGGMSFHGGLLGVIFAIFIFAYKNKLNFFKLSDLIVPFIPLFLGLGRLGNFINGELWGRITLQAPWAMLFPSSRSEDLLILSHNFKWKYLLNKYYNLPRHPSQLYEIFFEGILLFLIIHIFSLKFQFLGSISGLFLVCYGGFRFFIEFFRQPDAQLGLFLSKKISMGQILSLPMIILGIIMIMYSLSFVKKHYS